MIIIDFLFIFYSFFILFFLLYMKALMGLVFFISAVLKVFVSVLHFEALMALMVLTSENVVIRNVWLVYVEALMSLVLTSVFCY